MLTFLKKSKDVNAILVEKTDRLYGNFRDYVDVDDSKFEIHLVKEGTVLTPNSDSNKKLIHAEQKYYEEGVRIIETLKNAYILCKQQFPIEQRKLLNYLLSNCTLEGRKVSYDYNLPVSYFINFDSCRKKYPGLDSNQ